MQVHKAFIGTKTNVSANVVKDGLLVKLAGRFRLVTIRLFNNHIDCSFHLIGSVYAEDIGNFFTKLIDFDALIILYTGNFM